MPVLATLRPYLLALGGNGLVLLWTWLSFNHGKGLFFYTVDYLGLMLLLPLLALGNAGACLGAFVAHKARWAKAFGLLMLLLLGGCTATWVQGYVMGVTF